MTKKIRIGTRGSELALWQARHVAELIGKGKTELVIIKTEGDRIQNVSFNKMEGKGFFTKEIEDALLDNRIDLAVHSLKDLPTEEVRGLKLAAVPERADFHDLLIIRPDAYDEKSVLKIKKGSRIGTSSARRMAQLLAIDSSLAVEALMGNVNNRIRKLGDKVSDAIVMARAAVERISLGVDEFIIQELGCEIFLPAPAQGALGLQIREEDREVFDIIRRLNDNKTETLVTAERSFLKNFGGGCHIPLGAYAFFNGQDIILEGLIASTDGSFVAREKVTGRDPVTLGLELAVKIKSMGAEKYI
jgi:hydroxymethylbilane synthase